MGVRNASTGSKTILTPGVGNSAESTIFVSPPLNLPLDNALVIILWEVVVVLGAAQTTFLPNLRRGNTSAGTLISAGQTLAVTASTAVKYSGVYSDTPGIVAGQQYNLGLVVNGAASAGTVVDGSIQVIVL